MFNISKFFHKFQKIYQDESGKKEKIVTAIKDLTKIELKKDQILLKEGVLSITASPLVRNEIAIKKTIIIPHLLSLGLKVKDIR